MENVAKQKEIVFIQIFYLFLLPVFFLYFDIIPKDFRLVTFASISALLIGIIHQSKWTYKDLGIIKKWHKDLGPYLLFTLAGMLFLYWLANLVPHDPFLKWWVNWRFLVLFIPISVLQEVVFRGILMRMLKSAFDNFYIIIFINAVVFAVMHMIYVNHLLVLPLTFIGGIAFAWMYLKYPNLILISISHTIFNFVAMILGFFVLR